MTQFTALTSILIALSIGAISPGPSFLLISHISAARSRCDGFAAAAGVGFGSVIIAAISVAGFWFFQSDKSRIFLLIQAVSGLYLLWFGYRTWIASSEAFIMVRAIAGKASSIAFCEGLLTQILNPKTVATYAAILGTLLPNDVSVGSIALLLVFVFAIEMGWYSTVAFGLSSSRPRRIYAASKIFINRLAGSLIIVLGLGLLKSALMT